MTDRPRRFWRVEYDAAVGWDFPTDRQRRTRYLRSEEWAGRQLAAIDRLPSHLHLISVAVSNEIVWTSVDPTTIPRPVEENDDDG